jgi:hypothetical protein
MFGKLFFRISFLFSWSRNSSSFTERECSFIYSQDLTVHRHFNALGTLVLSFFKRLNLIGNCMSHLLQQSAALHFIFMGFV